MVLRLGLVDQTTPTQFHLVPGLQEEETDSRDLEHVEDSVRSLEKRMVIVRLEAGEA